LQLAQNSLRGLRPLRSNSCAKSDNEGAARLLQSPVLLDGSQGPQEQCGRCFATFPVNASLRIGANGVMRHQADAKRGRLVFVSPFGRAEQHRALRGARSAHPHLTSGGCLNAAAAGRVVSSARPAKTEQRKAALAQRGPSRQGSLLCLLSCRYKKGGRPPGRNPGAASRSEQAQRQSEKWKPAVTGM